MAALFWTLGLVVLYHHRCVYYYYL